MIRLQRPTHGRPASALGWRWTVLALGAAQTLGFVHTGWFGVPMLLAMAVLVYRLNQASPREAAWLGWCFGLGWLAAGVWWLYISMHRYGGLPAPLAATAVVLLSAALSLYLALACAAYAQWRSKAPARNALLFAALWLLAELARGLLFTGFPWLAAGYAFVDAPLAGLAPWIGVYGIGAVAAGLVAWVLSPTDSRRRFGHRQPLWLAAYRPLLAMLFVWAIGTWGAAEFTRSAGSLRVSLLQTAVAQNEKFALEQMPQTLLWLGKTLVAAQGELVVAPETALPLLPSQLEEFSPGYRAGLDAHFRGQGRHALIGLPLGDFESGYTNSVAGIGAPGPYRYDKVHLVPFGEFIPTGFRWFTELMNIPLGDFARGPLDAPNFEVRGQRVAPNICFEDLFGEELAVRFRHEAQAPTLLANISNIGWFDDSSALPQHLNISRMRTLELQRPMLRSTNTGMTAIVDHRGQVTAQLPPLQQGVLDGVVEGRAGNTPYAHWAGHYGLWPVAGGALALVVLLALWRPRSAGRAR